MKRQVVLFLGLIFSVSSLTFAQTKTITNTDLEKHRQKRLQAEREYRKNYKKSGLLSPEEMEEHIEESRIKRQELAARLQAEKDEKENYYQSRANDLRVEISSVESQIVYLRNQIASLPEAPSNNRIYSFGYFPNYRGYRLPFKTPLGNFGLPLQRNQQYHPGALRYRNPLGNYLYQGYGNSYFNGGYSFPIVVDNNNYERSELVSRLRLLEQRLAGLMSEWRLLEDQARRAGVKIY